MKLIADTPSLQEFCSNLENQEFITVDLEFIREKSYYAKLCLIQIGSPSDCAIIDPLAPELDLEPFFALLKNPDITKVFHSCRQDIEILYLLTGFIPAPLFDTQIAAMVLGYGESVSYEHLVNDVLNIELDKSSRLSDWSLRPLNETQLRYAISDVTHLVHIYENFRERLAQNGRIEWIKEEMDTINNPETYTVEPYEAWMRIRHRSHNPHLLTILRELAAWREIRAQNKNIPRQMIIKDDCLLTIAAICPHNREELEKIRNIRHDTATGKLGTEIIEILDNARNIPSSQYVTPPKDEILANGSGALYELLKLMLKIKCQQEEVVPRLIISDEDLRRFSSFKDKNCPILKGWRRKVFGEDALELRQGHITIGFNPETKRIDIKKGS